MTVTGAARTPRTGGLDSLLAEARSTLVRVSPRLAARAQREGGLLVDIRPMEQRRREGALPDALIIERNVLEWRLGPDSPWRIPELVDRDQVVVVVCSAGYASSLAAASLQRLGLVNATDMVGGFLARRRGGLPVVLPTARVVDLVCHDRREVLRPATVAARGASARRRGHREGSPDVSVGG